MRKAIAAAIDRKAIIEGAAEGYGVPIGSHYVPGAFGYVDTTGINPAQHRQSQGFAQRSGRATAAEADDDRCPAPYARQGGEIIAAQLAKVGIEVKLQNVEWAQWLSGTYGNKQYDLTIISHVEPFDLGNFAKPDYYWAYDSQEFRDLFERSSTRPSPPTAHACWVRPSACWPMTPCTAFCTSPSG